MKSKPFIRTLFWIVFSLLLVLGFDQFFLRVPQQHPVMHTIRQFYLDFRTRLFHLGSQPKPISVETLIEKEERRQPSKAVSPPQKTGEPSYFYADDRSELNFVDSL
ncbi:MAG: hypothetical protein P8X63_14500, partial [Desulfuromonadaceae bacterium]